MDTITEAASSEAEEVGQEGDETEAAAAAQDVSTAPVSEAREALQTTMEPEIVQEAPAEVPEKGEADHADLHISDKNVVENAVQATTHTPQNEVTLEDAAQATCQTKTENCSAEGETASVTDQAYHNKTFVVDDPDGRVVQV